jgi:hypothetical protein
MARIETDPNYTSPTFSRATAATDLFKKEDVQKLAEAMSTHDHQPGKGVQIYLPAGHVGNAQLADGAVTSVKIQDASIHPTDLMAGVYHTGIAAWRSNSATIFCPTNIASVPSLTWTIGAWEASNFLDVDNNIAQQVSQGLRVAVTGTYMINWGCFWSPSATQSSRYSTLARNGSPAFTYSTAYPLAVPMDGAMSAFASIVQVHRLNANDIIGQAFYQGTGATLTVSQAWLSVTLLGASG